MYTDDPLPFHDISWLAVRGADAQTLMEALNLSDPTPVSWKEGLSAVCGDYWDSNAPLDAVYSRAFITPNVDGWRLAVGGWLSDAGEGGIERIAGYCRALSETFGEACAFTSQNRMSWYSWVLAEGGEVYRKFLWDETCRIDEGAPTAAEKAAKIDAASSGRVFPYETDVMTIAAECSVSPMSPRSDAVTVGEKFLAVTPWGRAHGVPVRPLSEP